MNGGDINFLNLQRMPTTVEALLAAAVKKRINKYINSTAYPEAGIPFYQTLTKDFEMFRTTATITEGNRCHSMFTVNSEFVC